MKENVESGIRFKVALIYLVVAVVCGGMVLYVYNLRENIGDQKADIEQYYRALNLTNDLVFTVNEAQSEANFYVATRNDAHLSRFRRKRIEVERLIDSLRVLSHQETKDTLLIQVSRLLRDKGRIVSGLGQEFTNQNPVDTISQRLQSLDSLLRSDPVVVTTTITDTVVQTTPKKKFWERLSTVFSPDRSVDTLKTVQTQVVDSMRLSTRERADILSEMSVMTELASIDYTSRITAIEQQVSRLIHTDQQLSAQLSTLLNALSKQTLASTLGGIRESERLIRENYTFSVIGGAVALGLILLFVILIISDVNKGKAARRALRQIMDTRHRLFLSVSHDIKTPLNSISGSVEGWKSDRLVPVEQAVSVEQSASHILALMNNLLEFSNLEQGTQTVSESDFNLHALCREIAAMFEPLARCKQLGFESEFRMDRNLRVRGDVLKIKQVVINILSNAIKYTPRGSIGFHAAYLHGGNKPLAFFRIADTGAGIPADQMDKLFMPFRRVEKNNDLATGSGLGMYVVKGITDLLDGGIHVHSTEGVGTTVEVSIPVHTAKEPCASDRSAIHNILVVDDDPALLVVLNDLFVRLERPARTCNKPDEVAPLLDAQAFDLVVTDMEMGTVTGIDILHTVRRLQPNARVVVMTGRGDYDADRASCDGFDGYLPKPVGRAMLGELLGVATTDAVGGFESLEELFGNDREAIAEVLAVFAASTEENLTRLRSALDIADFAAAQAVCHKMLPMCEQVGVVSCLDTLRLMDSLRGQPTDALPDWPQRIATLLVEAEKTLADIRKGYLM